MMLLLIPSFSKEGYSRGGGRFLSRKNILKINDSQEITSSTGLRQAKKEAYIQHTRCEVAIQKSEADERGSRKT